MNASITLAFSRSEKGRRSYAPGDRLMRDCRLSKKQWDFLKKQKRLSQPAMTMRSCVGIAVYDFYRVVLAPNGARKWKSLTPAKARLSSPLVFSQHRAWSAPDRFESL